MIDRIRKILVFGTASAVTAAAWFVLLPQPAPVVSPPPSKPSEVIETRWNKERIDPLVTAVEQAATDEERLKAAAGLQQIPLADVEHTLDRVNLTKGRSLSFAAKVLLIRWAEEDGEGANRWAWKRFRADDLWDNAFEEIGPAWAARRPAALGNWALSMAGDSTPADTIDPQSEVPIPDRESLGKIARWLVTEDPRLAYQVLKERGGFASEDVKIPLALPSIAKVKEALTAFDDPKIKNPTRISGDEIWIYGLFSRWHELDPEDFKQSPHSRSITIQTTGENAAALERWKSSPVMERAENAIRWVNEASPESQGTRIEKIAETWTETDPDAAARWLDSLPPEHRVSATRARVLTLARDDLLAAWEWFDQLPADQRRNLIVPTFDAWTQAHPGQQADRTGWPAARARAWEDLEVLHPVQTR